MTADPVPTRPSPSPAETLRPAVVPVAAVDADTRWDAVIARDQSTDDAFVYTVVTTGIDL